MNNINIITKYQVAFNCFCPISANERDHRYTVFSLRRQFPAPRSQFFNSSGLKSVRKSMYIRTLILLFLLWGGRCASVVRFDVYTFMCVLPGINTTAVVVLHRGHKRQFIYLTPGRGGLRHGTANIFVPTRWFREHRREASKLPTGGGRRQNKHACRVRRGETNEGW